MYILILWLAKLVQFATRLFGNSGAALPGLMIEKLSKNFLGFFLGKLPEGVIVVSGTNGKTTTTKMIVDTLNKFDKKVFTNRTGSNMTRGLISAIVSKTDILGRLKYDIAVIEVDEAYAAKISSTIPIRGCVVLNIMRDQLDRFGEIDNTAKMLDNLTKSATDFVVLNANDSRVTSLKSANKSERLYFGASVSMRQLIPSEDKWHGVDTKTNKTKMSNVLINSFQHECTIQLGSNIYNLKTNVIGSQNHLNLLAALVCLSKIENNIEIAKLVDVISEVKPAFGRGEEVVIGDSKISIQLVKNPASFEQTVRSVDLKKFTSVAIVINDAYSDGRDVSWLWDVDFSPFASSKTIYASGTRAYDLAVRLKHENIKTDEIVIDEVNLLDSLIKKNGQHVVFCTYTAMLKIRRHLVKKGHARKVV